MILVKNMFSFDVVFSYVYYERMKYIENDCYLVEEGW